MAWTAHEAGVAPAGGVYVKVNVTGTALPRPSYIVMLDVVWTLVAPAGTVIVGGRLPPTVTLAVGTAGMI